MFYLEWPEMSDWAKKTYQESVYRCEVRLLLDQSFIVVSDKMHI